MDGESKAELNRRLAHLIAAAGKLDACHFVWLSSAARDHARDRCRELERDIAHHLTMTEAGSRVSVAFGTRTGPKNRETSLLELRSNLERWESIYLFSMALHEVVTMFSIDSSVNGVRSALSALSAAMKPRKGAA